MPPKRTTGDSASGGGGGGTSSNNSSSNSSSKTKRRVSSSAATGTARGQRIPMPTSTVVAAMAVAATTTTTTRTTKTTTTTTGQQTANAGYAATKKTAIRPTSLSAAAALPMPVTRLETDGPDKEGGSRINIKKPKKMPSSQIPAAKVTTSVASNTITQTPLDSADALVIKPPTSSSSSPPPPPAQELLAQDLLSATSNLPISFALSLASMDPRNDAAAMRLVVPVPDNARVADLPRLLLQPLRSLAQLIRARHGSISYSSVSCALPPTLSILDAIEHAMQADLTGPGLSLHSLLSLASFRNNHNAELLPFLSLRDVGLVTDSIVYVVLYPPPLDASILSPSHVIATKGKKGKAKAAIATKSVLAEMQREEADGDSDLAISGREEGEGHDAAMRNVRTTAKEKSKRAKKKEQAVLEAADQQSGAVIDHGDPPLDLTYTSKERKEKKKKKGAKKMVAETAESKEDEEEEEEDKEDNEEREVANGMDVDERAMEVTDTHVEDAMIDAALADVVGKIGADKEHETQYQGGEDGEAGIPGPSISGKKRKRATSAEPVKNSSKPPGSRSFSAGPAPPSIHRRSQSPEKKPVIHRRSQSPEKKKDATPASPGPAAVLSSPPRKRIKKEVHSEEDVRGVSGGLFVVKEILTRGVMTRSETARKNSLDDASAHLSPVFSVPSTSAVWSPARPSVSVVVADSQETVAPETEEEENVDAAENVAAANKARKADSSTLQDSESEYEEIEVEVEVDSDGNEIEAVEDQADLVVVADGDGVERNEEEKLELDAANVDVTEEEQKAEEANGRMVDKEARKDSSKEEVDVHEVAESENAMAADNAPATNYLVKTTPFDSIIEDSDLEEDFTAKVLNVNARVDESDEPVTLIPRIEPEFRDDDSEMDATQPYQETFATVEEEQDDEDMEQPESEDEAMPTNGQEDEEPESELEIPEEEEEEEEDDDDDTKTTLVDTQVPLIPVAHTPPASKTPFPTPAVAPLTNSPAKGTSPLPSPMARRSNYSTTVTNLGANAIPHHLRYQPAQRTLSTASMKLSTLANSNLFGGGAGRPPSLKEMSNAFGMDGLGNGGSLLNGLGAGHAQSDVSSAWVGGAAGVSGGRIAHGDDDSDDDSDVAGAADESSDDSSSDDDDDSDGDESDGNGIRAANKAGGPQFAGAEKRKKRRKSALSMLAMDASSARRNSDRHSFGGGR